MSNELENKVYAKQIMNIAREVLDDRYYDIVIATTIYSVPKTVLAEEYGISATRVSHIEAKGLRKIRQALGIN